MLKNSSGFLQDDHLLIIEQPGVESIFIIGLQRGLTILETLVES